jgi:hypothetical protein
VSPPSNGSITATGTTFYYTPTNGFSGTDIFTYTATNPGGTSNTATIELYVVPAEQELIPIALAASSSLIAYNHTGLITSNGMRDGLFQADSTIHMTPFGEPGWIVADLGEVRNVTSIKVAPPLVSFTGGGPSYLNNALIQHSTDGVSWTTVATVSGAANGAYTTINMGVPSRYIRIYKANDSVGLGDFMLYGGAWGGGAIASAPIAGTRTVNVPYNAVSYIIIPKLFGGTATSMAVTNPPGRGVVSQIGTTFYYTPSRNFVGPDAFSYTATNAVGTSSSATILIWTLPP